MGFGGIGIWQLLIVLVIIILLFGTKKLRGMGSDVGGALKNFKSALKDGEEEGEAKSSDNLADNGNKPAQKTTGTVIDAEPSDSHKS